MEGQDLAVQIYRVTATFPRGERFGLVAQLRRAAESVCSNIAEGCGRTGRGDFSRFLGYAIGSCCELESQLVLCERLGYLTRWREMPEVMDGLDMIRRGLIRLQNSVNQQR
jgi:four helix bundle protein